MAEEKIGYCTLCRSRCGATYTVDAGRLLDVAPAPGHPTGAALCPKGRAAPEIVHNPRRLTRPLRRTAPKTARDPDWREVSWEEAMREVADRFDRIRRESGPEAVAFAVTSPSGTPLSDGIDWVERFIRTFGSPNIVYATEICNWHKDFAHAFTFGCGIPTADYGQTDLALLWGHNPAKVWLAQSTVIAEAKARGARVAMVDPRREGVGVEADLWLRVRPGTDTALALGVARILLDEGAYDDAFVRSWTNAPLLVREDTGRFLREADLVRDGDADRYVVWDEIAREARTFDPAAVPSDPQRLTLHGTVAVPGREGPIPCRPAFQCYTDACSPWDLRTVEQVTWVPAATVRAFADEVGSARRIAYHSWSGVGQHTNATQTERAIALLYTLTGCFDTPGGNVVVPRHPVNAVTSFDQLEEPQRRKALGLGERPLGPPAQGWVTARDLCGAILDGEPYRVRGLMAFGSNLLLSQADPRRGQRALQALEFSVHCDLFATPTAELADIVLPVNSPWEREALKVGFEISAEAQELVQLRQRMVPAVGESRSDTEIVYDLATRLGLDDAFFHGDVEAGWNHVLVPLGLTVAQLRDRPEGIRLPLEQRYRKYAEQDDGGVTGFATRTRRVELYSELLHEHGYPAVPAYAEPADAPSAAYPYVLTSAKSGLFCHSQHRGLASLRRRSPEPSVDLNPELASREGILAGDWVDVSTRAGSIRLRARLDDALHPRVVVGEFGWWQANPDLGLPGYDPLSSAGSNYNLLITDDHHDPVSGSVPHRSFACSVRPATPGDHKRRWEGFRAFVIARVESETADTVSLTLTPADGAAVHDHRPGQHVTVRVDDRDGLEPMERSYSLTSAAGLDRPHAYRITVKRLPEDTGRRSVMSSHLTTAARPGDIVGLEVPRGAFLIPTDIDLPVVLIAAGIGITPFVSYLETLAANGGGPEVTLHYCSRDGGSHIFQRRLRELTALLPRLTTITHYSRPSKRDRLGQDYQVRGRITAVDVDQRLMDRRARFYLCGPELLLQDVARGLVDRGVPGFDIFRERFRSPEPVIDVPPDATYSVRLARSGRVLTWRRSSGTLLELGARAGVRLPSGCRVGECESCALTVLSGSVRHLLDDLETSDDRCLTCQAIPASDLVLDG